MCMTSTVKLGQALGSYMGGGAGRERGQCMSLLRLVLLRLVWLGGAAPDGSGPKLLTCTWLLQ
jgi:hypothetical protein